MQLKKFQEKQFIHKILGPLASTAAIEAFDDAVVINLSQLTTDREAPYLVYSVDQPSFVAHADQNIDPYRYYGRWVAGATCNDVIAMGGRCRGFSLALAAPLDAEVDNISSLVQGITDVMEVCGAEYEGGNFDLGPLSTVGVAWGSVPQHALVRRSGARPGDKIVVTGELGLGWLEYQIRKHGLSSQIQHADTARFLQYKAMPVGAASAVAAVADKGWFTSGMDLSDGLIEFLYTVMERNGLGCVIDAEALPVSPATRRNLPLLAKIIPAADSALRRRPYLIALEPGYDSPLLHAFTIDSSRVKEAQHLFEICGHGLHVIGEVTDERTVLLRQGGDHAVIVPFWDDQLRQEGNLDAWVSFVNRF